MRSDDHLYVGKKYGRLTILSSERIDGAWYWRCKCDCGNEKYIMISSIKSGKTRSCGCLHDEMSAKRNRKFKNKTNDNHRLYGIYNGIKSRCYRKTLKRYPDYGGRGIRVCDEWLNPVDGFDNFVEWSKNNGYSENMTIDRIDVDGNYCPKNCRWITLKDQARNKRDTIYVEYDGKKWKLVELCEAKGVCYDTVHDRIRGRGWDVKRAVEEPSQREKSFSKLCKEHGLNPGTVKSRVRKLGWSLDRALNTPSLGRGANKESYGLE